MSKIRSLARSCAAAVVYVPIGTAMGWSVMYVATKGEMNYFALAKEAYRKLRDK